MKRFNVNLNGSAWFLMILMLAGCGSKIYVPPASRDAGILIIENKIHPPGFSVSVDKKRADYLKRRIRIPLAPGEHTVKLFNRSTVIKSSMYMKEERTFNYKLEVAAGEVKQIALSWDDPSYKYKGDEWKTFSKEQELAPTTEGEYPYFPGLPTSPDTPQSTPY